MHSATTSANFSSATTVWSKTLWVKVSKEKGNSNRRMKTASCVRPSFVFLFSYFAFHLGGGKTAHAHWAFDGEMVRCLPDVPSICVGEMQWITPVEALNPCAYNESCPPGEEFYWKGGHYWIYEFVQGLKEGDSYYAALRQLTDSGDPYLIGLRVEVALDVDGTICSVKVNNDTCSDCSVCSFEGPNPYQYGVEVSADCENLDGGRKIDCEEVRNRNTTSDDLGSFFYPFELPSLTVPPDDLCQRQPKNGTAPCQGNGGQAPTSSPTTAYDTEPSSEWLDNNNTTSQPSTIKPTNHPSMEVSMSPSSTIPDIDIAAGLAAVTNPESGSTMILTTWNRLITTLVSVATLLI